MRSLPLITTAALLLPAQVQAADRNPPRPPQVDATAAVAEAPADLAGEGAVTAFELPAGQAAAAQLQAAMAVELQQARTEEGTALAELVAALEAAPSEVERLEIQRRIVKVKGDAAERAMSIRINYARAAGLTEQADRMAGELEQYLAQRNAPRAAITTGTDRRVPAAGGAAR